ncbi:MAG: glycerol-3-phosphate dehydrogenase/oxidase [Actinomycetota bacterium]|nr:glycerol-3-phosphate dehydrogenase/oxidase [Actinomycetota bacterium]
MPPVPALSLAGRRQAWEALGRRSFDVLVVGGGVTGAGAALDAASRGLSVALVEGRDFASGTSSRSSKLFHGGLRYLEQFDFHLVREALRERDLMVERLAPHLVRPVSFAYPLSHHVWERAYVAAGMLLYDTLGGGRVLPRHRHLSRRGLLAHYPGLLPGAMVGAIRYWDAQTDDARHTLTVARTAAAQGAVVRNSTEVTGLNREGARVVGADVRDTETGDTLAVRAGAVVNCTGVWTDDIHRLSGTASTFRVQASKGVHLLVARDRIDADGGLILRTERSVLFVIPWGPHWIIGTTDTPWDLEREHPAATSTDIDYILAHVNRVLVSPLSHDDVIGVYVGLRPLLAGEAEDTTRLSREHAVARPVPGLVSIAGGKYTTYRVMARDAIDAAVGELGRAAAPSVTDQLPLLGADGYAGMVNRVDGIAERHHLRPAQVTHLLERYGSLIDDVLAPAAEDPTLLEGVAGAAGYLRAEVVYGATHEGALHLDDLLARRTRISIEEPHRGTDSAAEAASLVGGVLGWDWARQAEEVTIYRSRVVAERESQRLADDRSAEEARLAGGDARPAALAVDPLT